jgi:hypothetical protein
MNLTLVTATLPERANLLREMFNTVLGQTVQPACHVVMRDHGAGFVDTVNRAVAMVDTEFFCLVDDDDLLRSHHVETLSKAVDESVDIVWLWRDLDGYREGHGHPDWDLLKRAETLGARFLNIPEVTWVYRFHGGNMSV